MPDQYTALLQPVCSLRDFSRTLVVSTDTVQTGFITETDADVRADLLREEASILPEAHFGKLQLRLSKVQYAIESVLTKANCIAKRANLSVSYLGN